MLSRLLSPVSLTCAEPALQECMMWVAKSLSDAGGQSFSTSPRLSSSLRPSRNTTKGTFCEVAMPSANVMRRLREDRSRWRQADTLELWREILQLSELAHKPIILMLNKVDIFKQKIQKKGIDCFWTDYKGPAGDWEPAADYIRNQFLQRVVSPKDQPVVVHFLCAVDTSHVEQIWTGLRDVLLKKAVMELMDSCMT